MSNINDYLRWRGDILIDKNYPFNELDSLILARFSYLLFHKIEMEDKVTIESIAKKMEKFKNEEFLFNGDKELITNLGTSNRFKNMIVTDFARHNNKQAEKQFSAITIHVSKKEMYISYIGTDDTLYGWKEDFNMAYMDEIPSQKEGAKYLRDISKKYPRKRIRVGGHSKGGNIAIYASVCANSKIKKKIIKVYSYDGPGLNKKVAEAKCNDDFMLKVRSYIPQDSIIGRVLEHKEEREIVKSIEKGIMQHDIYSWQVTRDDFEIMEGVTKNSEYINKTINNWLESTTSEQREVFIDIVFELLNGVLTGRVEDFLGGWTQNIPKISKKYKKLPDESKKSVTSMIKEFIKAYFKTIRSQ